MRIGTQWTRAGVAAVLLGLLAGCPQTSPSSIFFGVTVDDTTLASVEGVLVTEVTGAGSPLVPSQALQANDIITALNGTSVSTIAELRTQLARIDTTLGVDLSVHRIESGAARSLIISFAGTAASSPMPTPLGFSIIPAPASDPGASAVNGVAVAAVSEAALSALLDVGDVIVRIAGKSVNDPAQFHAAVAGLTSQSGTTVTVGILGAPTATQPAGSALPVVDVVIPLPARIDFDLPMINARVQALTLALAQRYGYTPAGGKGVKVLAVVADSPASEAGLQRDDVIVELDGQPVTAEADLLALVPPRVGQCVSLVYFRSGKRNTVAQVCLRLVTPGPDLPDIGMTLEAAAGGGLSVRAVTTGGPAATADPALAAGDVILRVDGQAFSAVAKLNNYLQDKKAGDSLLIEFRRGDVQRQTVLVLVEEVEETPAATARTTGN